MVIHVSTTQSILLPGATVHLIRGTKYHGPVTLTTVGEPDTDGWRPITAGRVEWFTRDEDAYTTEADARAAAKARRQPRQPKRPAVLYGDWGQLAALNGMVNEDGAGRNRKSGRR